MRTNTLLLSLLISSLAVACGDDKPGPGGGGGEPVDAGDDSEFDAAFAVDAAVAAPLVASVDYPVIAHGGKLVLTGENLAGATSVSIGGVAHDQLSAVSATSVTVDAVLGAVAVGAQVPSP